MSGHGQSPAAGRVRASRRTVLVTALPGVAIALRLPGVTRAPAGASAPAVQDPFA